MHKWQPKWQAKWQPKWQANITFLLHTNTPPFSGFHTMFSLSVNSLKGGVCWRAAPITSFIHFYFEKLVKVKINLGEHK